ncbi:MAG: type I-E CRISPR-associated protein Cas6/Cse3/CasE [Nitrospira sp.]|nr:type I-E CRISPR-associated protein Cas6/Cse3/CasE [Nitrospira sp.]
MQLSRLILNPRNAGARRDASLPYELHRTLLRGLDASPSTFEERLLFRVEPETGFGGPVVMVQSQNPPDWSPFLRNGYLVRADGPKAFRPQIEAGQVLHFRLVANPVIKKKAAGKKHSVRVPLIHLYREDNRTRFEDKRGEYAGYYDWLMRKGVQHGFSVIKAQDAPFRLSQRSRLGEAKSYEKRDIPHFGVRFDGELRVEDPVLLLEALRKGIGPAKAFGFGLLSLAPASAAD